MVGTIFLRTGILNPWWKWKWQILKTIPMLLLGPMHAQRKRVYTFARKCPIFVIVHIRPLLPNVNLSTYTSVHLQKRPVSNLEIILSITCKNYVHCGQIPNTRRFHLAKHATARTYNFLRELHVAPSHMHRLPSTGSNTCAFQIHTYRIFMPLVHSHGS